MAAQCYESIAPYTEAAADAVLTIETWRMSAYCWWEDNYFTLAWNAGLNALKIGLPLGDDIKLTVALASRLIGCINIMGAGRIMTMSCALFFLRYTVMNG